MVIFFKNTPKSNKSGLGISFGRILYRSFIRGLIGDLFIYLRIPIFLSVVIAIAFSVLITGAFHEDGLADSADGLGRGNSKRINGNYS